MRLNGYKPRRIGPALRLLTLPVLALCLLAASACQDKGLDQIPALERIRRGGVLKIGYANEAPFAYHDPEADRLTGEAPEIARKLAKRMGIKQVEGVLTEFGALIPGLKARRFDMIAAGMYILPERCKEIAFTHPTYKTGEAFLVKKGNPLKLHSYEDLAKTPDARLGVVAGAVELGYARAVGVPEDRIVILPDAPSAVAALQSGRIDAYAGTSLTINDMMNKVDEKELEKATPFTDPVIEGKRVIGYGAFGVRKEDEALLRELNMNLEDLIGSEAHRQMIAPFGLTASELPGDVRAETLCKGSNGSAG